MYLSNINGYVYLQKVTPDLIIDVRIWLFDLILLYLQIFWAV